MDPNNAFIIQTYRITGERVRGALAVTLLTKWFRMVFQDWSTIMDTRGLHIYIYPMTICILRVQLFTDLSGLFVELRYFTSILFWSDTIQFTGWWITTDWFSSVLTEHPFKFHHFYLLCSLNGENVSTNRMRPASAPAHVRAIDETSGRADKSISPKVKMANIVQTQMESGLLFPDIRLDKGRPCCWVWFCDHIAAHWHSLRKRIGAVKRYGRKWQSFL